MENSDLISSINKITQDLNSSEFNLYIDNQFKPPIPYHGNADIKLIILGQDPTVQNPEYRKKVNVTLLLDRPGRIRIYLERICNSLGISLEENIYATNLLKNFFIQPPDQLRQEKPEFIKQVSNYWIPLLIKEIAEFENIPILTLGEPVLNCLTKTSDTVLIRNFWGYEGPGKYGKKFHYLLKEDNVLNRNIFPFPHIHGIGFKFYRDQINDYLAYMKSTVTHKIVADE